MKSKLLPLLLALLLLIGCAPQEQAEDRHAMIPTVMVDGKLYCDTGRFDDNPRCGMCDGTITSTVEGWELPTENNQSNFGKGYGYQRVNENTIEINIPGTGWCVFEHGSGQGKIKFQNRWYDKGFLSPETVEWIEWYYSLPLKEQEAVDSIPAELAPDGPVETTEAS